MLAGIVIDAVSRIAEQRRLTHLQDVGSIILSEIGLFFNTVRCSTIPTWAASVIKRRPAPIQVFPEVDMSERKTVLQLVKKVHQFCVRGNTDPDSAPAFIARFFARLLRLLDTQSRMQSRIATPVGTPIGISVGPHREYPDEQGTAEDNVQVMQEWVHMQC
jgi:hypothetical protein